MNHNQEKNNNKESENDETNKNEEDLLGYSSKYKTNVYKEEDNKENEIVPKDVRKRLSVDSTSISQEYSAISSSNSKNIKSTTLEEDVNHRSIGLTESSKKLSEYHESKRKMSSPLCCYYDGSDKYLSKIQKNNIDIDKSPNFIKKDNFFNDNINNNNFINDNHNNFNINLLYRNSNFKMNNNINDNKNENIENYNEIKRLSYHFNKISYNNINNFNIMTNNNIINNNYFFNNNSNYQPQIFNINYINLNNFPNNPINNNISRRKLSYNIEEGIIGNYFNNILNLNNNSNPNEKVFNIPHHQPKLNPILFSYNEEQERFNKNDINRKSSNKTISNKNKDKKPFDKRKGDWLCPECHNLNFAFRVVCNRCQIPKPSNLDPSN